MTVSIPSVLLSAGGGAAVVAAAFFTARLASDSRPEPRPVGDEVFIERLDALEHTLAGSAPERVAAELRAIGERLASVESRLDREPVAAPAAPASTERVEPSAQPASHGSTMTADRFRGMLASMVRSVHEGSASPEQQAEFWKAARTTPFVDDAIEELEELVEGGAADADTRMELADAYVAKLLTVTAGPERGIWGMKAESQWQTIVATNPDHWDAQYALAFNYSMYPDFLNKADDAIAGFERALEIQSRQKPRPEHAQTFVHLARMHRKNGDAQKAREVIEQGLRAHPRDADLQEAFAETER